jgi:hypothetical protein
VTLLRVELATVARNTFSSPVCRVAAEGLTLIATAAADAFARAPNAIKGRSNASGLK